MLMTNTQKLMPASASDPPANCLVVLHGTTTAAPALVSYATALASVIHARVVILRVRKRSGVSAPEQTWPVDAIEVDGDLTDGLERAAELLQPILIMVCAEEQSVSKGGLRTRPTVPVFVWRGTSRFTRILAASDLQHPRFPVLRGGNDVAAWIQAPLVVLHNIKRLPAIEFPPTEHAISFALQDALSVGSAMLMSALRSLEITAYSIVSYRPSTAAVITETARRELADLIVVGRRARPWWKRVLARDVADEIIRTAEFSVLIIPM